MSSYDPFEDQLRQVLLAEAQTVTPAGDGLSQIRAKVARRRDRLRWLRPGLAVATAAGLAGAAVLAASLTDATERTLKQDRQPATRPPSATGAPAPVAPSGVALPSAKPPSVAPPVTARAYTVWPYTSLAQVQASRGPYLDPAQTALGFMGFLQAPEVDKVLANKSETTSAGVGRAVTLGRKMADGTVRAVTVVHLVQLHNGSVAPYAVTRAAGAYTLKISSPAIAAPVRSPLTVRGTIDGVHQSIRVELLSPFRTTPISAPVSAPGSATTGWSTAVSFTAPASGVWTLVARTDSDAGDGALQITAQPVLLTAGGTTSSAYPATFVAAATGRIAVFDSTTGAVVRYLTTAQPGGGDSQPAMSADRRFVYFVRGAGTCASGIWRVPTAGGTATAITDSGSALGRLGVSFDSSRIAYTRYDCTANTTVLVIHDLSTGRQRTITLPSSHLESLGRPAWAPDGQHVALAVTSLGGAESVRVFDVRSARTDADGATVPCPSAQPCITNSAAYDSSGRLSYHASVDHSDAGRMVRLAAGRVETLFTFSTDLTTPGVDLDASGVAAIWVEGAKLMRWNGGRPVAVSGTAEAPSW